MTEQSRPEFVQDAIDAFNIQFTDIRWDRVAERHGTVMKAA